MDQQTHDRVNTATTGDIPGNQGVKNPGLGWMMGFIATVSFVGIFSIVLLRKVRILFRFSPSVYSLLCFVFSNLVEYLEIVAMISCSGFK